MARLGIGALTWLAPGLLLAACQVTPPEVGTSEAAVVGHCHAVLTMEPGSPSDPSQWRSGRDGWGAPAEHHAAPGASAQGYAIDVREGNAYATLVLSEAARLRPGTYELSFAVQTSKLDGGCADAAKDWVEVGAKPGAFADADFNDGRWFTRAVVEDFDRSCNRFATYDRKLTVDLAAGGSLAVALKVGSSGGGVRATFDDVALACVGGECMTCSSEPPPPPASDPGCETRGALRACASSIRVEQDFDVELEGGRPRYPRHERRATRHDTMTLTNDRGVSLTFLKSAMGARLYQATARGAELLYTNPTPRVQDNWGQGGFPVFGGVESAWPVEEHGWFGNIAWESHVTWTDRAVAFVARGSGTSVDGSAAAVTITTSLATGEESWTQRVEIEGQPGAENMVYTNVMVDAGTKERPADLEVIIPGLRRAQVHSRGDADAFLPAGENAPAAEFDWPVHAGRDVSRINTTIASWLGFFAAEGAPRSQSYGYFDHSRGHGLVVRATDGAGFYPKFFCGKGITADASGSGKAYCELWFSPNARTFWDHPVLATAKTVHEVRISPVYERAAFDR